MDNEKQNKQLEDMVEIKSTSLTMSIIESIARDPVVRSKYEEDYSDNLYSSILMSLIHETIDETEAQQLWHEIIDHMSDLESTLNRTVGISVAALDYLSNIKNILSEPKIIEEEKSDFVAQSSTKDELTGLYLKDVFNVTLSRNINEHKRSNTPLSLLMIDIDDFKIVNDEYGHQKGDQVLSTIGQCVNEIVRDMDLAARYGGEELAVILPSLNIKQAFMVGERIREAIQILDFDGFSVTVSIGASSFDKNTSNTADKLIKKADEALYRAKDLGKNRTVI